MRVLVSGAAGFIGRHVCAELIARGHVVTGIDNHSKYGLAKPPPGVIFREGDCRDWNLMAGLLLDCDHFIAGAAMVGGISYFHAVPYDLLAVNEAITAAAVRAAITAREHGCLRKVTWVSSSMVYESATVFPSREGDELEMPPPRSSYGFQKLAVEYHARAAFEQYGLPFTIVRPFNAVGTGEVRAQAAGAGDREHMYYPDLPCWCGGMPAFGVAHSGQAEQVSLAMSHVVPDLCQKALRGQDPLRILGDGSQVRHYTWAPDLAAGIVTAMEHPDADGEDFNLSSDEETTVLELATLIWERVHPGEPLRVAHDAPFPHDVARRSPSTGKARRVLGWEAVTRLPEMLDVMIPWVREAIGKGLL